MVKYGKTKRGGYVGKYYKTAAPKRKFDSTLFNLVDIETTKRDAKIKADYWKMKRRRIRIVKTADRWCVYIK